MGLLDFLTGTTSAPPSREGPPSPFGNLQIGGLTGFTSSGAATPTPASPSPKIAPTAGPGSTISTAPSPARTPPPIQPNPPVAQQVKNLPTQPTPGKITQQQAASFLESPPQPAPSGGGVMANIVLPTLAEMQKMPLDLLGASIPTAGDQDSLVMAREAMKTGDTKTAREMLDRYDQEQQQIATNPNEFQAIEQLRQLHGNDRITGLLGDVTAGLPAFFASTVGGGGPEGEAADVASSLLSKTALSKLAPEIVDRFAQDIGSNLAQTALYSANRSQSPQEFPLNAAHDFVTMFPGIVGTRAATEVGGALVRNGLEPLVQKGANAIMDLVASAARNGVEVDKPSVKAFLNGKPNLAMESVWRDMPRDAQYTLLRSQLADSEHIRSETPDTTIASKSIQDEPEESKQLAADYSAGKIGWDDFNKGVQDVARKQTPIDAQSALMRSANLHADDIASRANADSMTDIVKKTVRDPSTQVNILDYLKTPANVLKKIGLADNAKELQKADDEYVVNLRKDMDWARGLAQQVKGVPNASQRIFRSIEGDDSIKLTDAEANVKQQIVDYFDKWAKYFGIPNNKNYITHVFDTLGKGAQLPEDVEKAMRSEQLTKSVYNPFLNKRYGMEGYKEDAFAALDAYMKRANRKAAFDQPLADLSKEADRRGFDNSTYNYLKQYTDRINMRPTQAELLLNNYLKSLPVLGSRMGDRPTLRAVNSVTRLFHESLVGGNISTVFKHVSQGMNVYSQLGEKYTIVGMVQALKHMATGDLSEIKDNNLLGGTAGTYVDSQTQHVLSTLRDNVDSVLFAGINNTIKTLKLAAYYGAKAEAKNKGMDEAAAQEYAKSLARKTVFNFSRVDTPLALSSPAAKLLFPFQSFILKQGEFATNMMKEAFRGDAKQIAGLIRYTAGSALVLGTIGKALGLGPQEFVPYWGVIQSAYNDFSGQSPAGGIGGSPTVTIPTGIAKAVINAPDQYGQQQQGNVFERLINTWQGQQAGSPMDLGPLAELIPGGNQARKTLRGLAAINQGGFNSKSGKSQDFPIDTNNPSEILKALIFGPYGTQAGQDFLNSFNKPKATAPQTGAGSSAASPNAIDSYRSAWGY